LAVVDSKTDNKRWISEL